MGHPATTCPRAPSSKVTPLIKIMTSNFPSRYQGVPIHHWVIKGPPLWPLISLVLSRGTYGLKEQDIDRSHRIGRPHRPTGVATRRPRTRPIIIKFTRYNARSILSLRYHGVPTPPPPPPPPSSRHQRDPNFQNTPWDVYWSKSAVFKII